MQRLPRNHPDLVTTARLLRADGVSRHQLATELRAGRWQRAGLAVVLHNGPLSTAQERRVARVHAGPRSVLTAFTAAEVLGVRGWERSEIDVLAPAGTRRRAECPVPFRLHRYGSRPVRTVLGGGVEVLPDALLRAAATFESARPASGILAAAVQQRRIGCEAILESLRRSPRLRHHAALLAAVEDIAGGSEALSEIDFVRLCRRHGLPELLRQEVRLDSEGRRRSLDATWRRADGRLVVAEVDGGLHLIATNWWKDQLRQNELALADANVLRFPTVVVRVDDERVARQVRRALQL